jgi:hypothetical protein
MPIMLAWPFPSCGCLLLFRPKDQGVPGGVAPDKSTPAPWVPFTRAGCDVGETGTVNQDLENTSVDIPKVFGANSPENAQLTADTDSFKDAETADYVGIAVHCAHWNRRVTASPK